eukprot:TRINITY_DN18265_c0_g1_i1.p1 TRINITY_DN18265_c0_g1~~TRINITY_DN18265_c0_g1_i1.p1  ORF type:complete len:640 (+),score=184.78 TRINITY_DN18265_c0_g1_i1:128-2047(+)
MDLPVGLRGVVADRWQGVFEGGDPSGWRSVGKGSNGTVYVAKRVNSTVEEAVKVIQEPEPDPEQDAALLAAGERTAFEKLFEEVRILHQMQHPNVVGFSGAWYPAPCGDGTSARPAMWVCMEHCAGGSVESLAPLEDERQLRYVCWSVCRALGHIHRAGVIHRDVRAGNIFCTAAGQVKLGDFGVAVRIGDSPDGRRGSTIGTPHWMAPEVILNGRRYDGRCDVWSLGVTAIETADGEPPMFSSSPLLAMFQIPRLPPATLNEHRHTHEGLILCQGSSLCRHFIARCMTKELEARPQSWELISDPWLSEADMPGPEVMLEAMRVAALRPVLQPTQPQVPRAEVAPGVVAAKRPLSRVPSDSSDEGSNGTFVERCSDGTFVFSGGAGERSGSDGDPLSHSRRSLGSRVTMSGDGSDDGATFIEHDDVSDVGTTEWGDGFSGDSVPGSVAGRISPAPLDSPRITAGPSSGAAGAAAGAEAGGAAGGEAVDHAQYRGPHHRTTSSSADWSRRRSVIDAVLYAPPQSPPCADLAASGQRKVVHQRTKGFDATFFTSLDHCLEGLLPDLEPAPDVQLAAADADALSRAARILGLGAPPTTKRALKEAYHNAAKVWHPDRCRSDKAEENFKHIQAAYQQLLPYVT